MSDGEIDIKSSDVGAGSDHCGEKGSQKSEGKAFNLLVSLWC